jgi:hypothetical protein
MKYHTENTILRVSPNNGVEPCCLPFGKAGELQILCCQGIKVTDYNFTLDAPALRDEASIFILLRGSS